jgi:hypothetical protein
VFFSNRQRVTPTTSSDNEGVKRTVDWKLEMKSSFSFSGSDQRTGLVIVFPPEVAGLFNPEIHGFVRKVEKALEGTYVVYALSSGASPTLRDAISAARFVGCESAVVIQSVEQDAARPVDWSPGGDWLLASSSVGNEFDVSAVVDSYRSAFDSAEKAA